MPAYSSVPVVLVVENHWLVGKLSTDGRRVLDILNDPRTDYLTLKDVKVFGRGDRQRCLRTVSPAVIPKAKLQMLVIPTDKFEPPRPERLHKLVEKKRFNGFLVVAGYAVSGTLHVPKVKPEPLYVFTSGLSHFFPVTGATLTPPNAEAVRALVVMANKDFVSCFHAEAETREQEPKVNRPSAIASGTSGTD